MTGAKINSDGHEDKLKFFRKINSLLSRYFIGFYCIYLLSLFYILPCYSFLVFPMRLSSVSYVKYHPVSVRWLPVLAAVLTMLSNLGSDFQTEILPTTIYVLIGFGLFKLLIIIYPNLLFFSKSVSSHPLEIFLVILIAGFLFWYFRWLLQFLFT
jgi:hypothetical protein